MNKKDDFDKFLKSRFQKAEISIQDNGFTEKVISRLPDIPDYSIRRNIVLFTFGILSVIIFIISNGYRSLINAIIDVINDSMQLVKPSIISLIVIAVFICILSFIAGMEYNRNTI